MTVTIPLTIGTPDATIGTLTLVLDVRHQKPEPSMGGGWYVDIAAEAEGRIIDSEDFRAVFGFEAIEDDIDKLPKPIRDAVNAAIRDAEAAE